MIWDDSDNEEEDKEKEEKEKEEELKSEKSESEEESSEKKVTRILTQKEKIYRKIIIKILLKTEERKKLISNSFMSG